MGDARSDHEPPTPHFVLSGPLENPRRIACLTVPGGAPTVLWLGGYRSDMRGIKAERLAAFAAARGRAFCRFDYSGHGESSGRFTDGTISIWLEDAQAVVAAATSGPLVLVGSSMGAWIALRLVAALREAGAGGRRIAGMLLLAPAPDFTKRLVAPALGDGQRADLETKGYCTEPSAYGAEPDIYTRALLEDGERHLVMDGVIETGCPVHVIHGMADPDVPSAHALDLVARLPADGVTLTLVPDGDHRLSREEDLVRMERALDALTQAA